MRAARFGASSGVAPMNWVASRTTTRTAISEPADAAAAPRSAMLRGLSAPTLRSVLLARAATRAILGAGDREVGDEDVVEAMLGECFGLAQRGDGDSADCSRGAKLGMGYRGG